MKRRVMPSAEPETLARKTAKRERLTRNGMVTAWNFDLSAHGASGPSFPTRWGGASLSATGEFTEPCNGVVAFDIMFIGVNAKDHEANAAVGMFLKSKPKLDGFVYLPWPDLGALVTFAAAGRPLHCALTFEKLRYGAGDIQSFTASTKPLG